MQKQIQRIRRYHREIVDSVNKSFFKYKDTYMSFDIVMSLYRKYDLVELESRIRRVCFNKQVLREISISKEIDVKVQPSDIAD